MADLIAQTPDRIRAIEAMEAADSLLFSSNVSMEREDYACSFEESRNAIRVAASAMLFKDGYVAKTLESTIDYLEKGYPDIFPCSDWTIIEKTVTGYGPGLFNILVRAFGKGADREKALYAHKVASEFLELVKSKV